MTGPRLSYEQLIEKMVRAKIHLQAARRSNHRNTCPMEDPESYAPCNCGVSDSNRPLDAAIRELTF